MEIEVKYNMSKYQKKIILYFGAKMNEKCQVNGTGVTGVCMIQKSDTTIKLIVFQIGMKS